MSGGSKGKQTPSTTTKLVAATPKATNKTNRKSAEEAPETGADVPENDNGARHKKANVRKEDI